MLTIFVLVKILQMFGGIRRGAVEEVVMHNHVIVLSQLGGAR